MKDAPITLDDIYVKIGDMEELLTEWTETWGPVKRMWNIFEERLQTAIRDNTLEDLKANFIEFAERTRAKVKKYHLDHLALVDLNEIDLEEVREGWSDALHVMQMVLSRLAVADGIIILRLEQD
jgi:hypothetical protein